MTTIYLAWQQPASQRWFPVGRLMRYRDEGESFEFAYLRGAKDAQEVAGFKEIPEFPCLARRYRASELFPTFRHRIMNTSRRDRARYLHELGLDENRCDPLTELSTSGGRSRTDGFEIFPDMEPDPDGRFHTQLTVHGLRHMNTPALEAVQALRPDDALGIALELDNPATGIGLLVRTHDYHILGWLPTYITEMIRQCGDWTTLDANVTVAQANHHAPLSHRLRVNFSGRLPSGVHPMRDLPQYQLITEPDMSAGTRGGASTLEHRESSETTG